MKRPANKETNNPGTPSFKAVARIEEDEIRDVKTLYHTLFEQFPDPVILIDPQTTLPLAFNEKALELLGYTAEEFRRLPISAYEAREQREEINNHVEKIINKGRDEFETQMRTRQGEIKDVLVNVQVVDIDGRKFFNSIFRDITEKKRAENALKVHVRQQVVAVELGNTALREESLAQLMDKIVVTVAATLDVRYCKVLEWLPGQNSLLLCAGVGWRKGMVGQAMVPAGNDSQAGYTLQSNAPVIVENLRTETRFSGPQFLHEHNVISGVSVIIQGEAGPWGVLGVHTDRQRLFMQEEVNFLQTIANILADAIERKTFIEILKKSEAKFRGLLESAADGVVISNATGEIEMVNAHLETMTGYQRHELIGQPVEILLPERITGHEDFRREFLKHPQARMMGNRGAGLNIRRKDGSEFQADISLVPLQLETGIIVSVTIRDITNRMQTEQTSRQTQDRLRRLTTRLNAAREEERTRVAREIHDELGQSLTGLKMDLSWILARVPKKLKTLSERIQGTIALVESTINFVRRLATSLRPAILDDLGLGAAIEWQIQGFAARTGCRYKLELDCPDFTAVNDRDTTVFRIFQEALTNIARHARADYVDISLRINNTHLLLSIKDNGIGIPLQKLTDNHSLGLIGMRERAGTLGGEVLIEPEEGKGTRVSLTIPIAG